MLKHSVLHFPLNFRCIASGVAETTSRFALLPERRNENINKKKYIFADRESNPQPSRYAEFTVWESNPNRRVYSHTLVPLRHDSLKISQISLLKLLTDSIYLNVGK